MQGNKLTEIGSPNKEGAKVHSLSCIPSLEDARLQADSLQEYLPGVDVPLPSWGTVGTQGVVC